ncbi:MAG: MFS transporter [Alphaproteobacteria bacterium]|nr:MFS transporter [Alphaproteobacteria bacterium]
MFATGVLAMSGSVAFPALLPEFQDIWGLANADAGLISGVFFVGYVATVPIATALTDRIPARHMVLAGLVLSAVANVGFGAFAEGLWSACLWRALLGAGFAGVYMPAIKAVSDTLPAGLQGRGVAFLTASFAFGNGTSFLFTGLASEAFGWRAGFALLALGPVIGMVLALVALAPVAPATRRVASSLLDFRPVLKNLRALGYMLCYGLHNLESSTMRAWTVAYLVFAASHQETGSAVVALSPTLFATVINVAGLPAILLAQEAAARIGRRPVVAAIMLGSAGTGVLLGALPAAPALLLLPLLLVWGFLVPADSGTINAGLVAVAEPARRGATLGLHAVVGFSGGFLGPVVFGAALDLMGGASQQSAWVAAFATIAALATIGPVALFLLDRPRR